MIPDDVKNHLHEILEHKMFEMNRSLADAFVATETRALREVGSLLNGWAMSQLARDARNSLAARGDFVLAEVMRCLAAYRVPLSSGVIEEAADVISRAIHTQAQIIHSHLFIRPSFGKTPAAAKHQIEIEFGQEAPRLTRHLISEIRLAAAASSASTAASSQSGAPQNYTFNGPVALIQTGAMSSATVQQHLTGDVRGQIKSVLETMRDHLDSPEGQGIPNRLDLREIILEAKEEAEKLKPNGLKLSTSLRTIAETTKFIGALRPAYDVLKSVLGTFGVQLP